MARKLHPRDQLMSNLRSFSGVDASKIDRLEDYCVVIEYFKRDNHCGGVMFPMGPRPEKRTLSNGKTVSFKDVRLEEVIKNVESFIKSDVEEQRRSEVWHKVFDGASKHRSVPPWAVRPPNPHEHPATPFSKSKAANPKPNQLLLEILGTAAKLEARKVDLVGSNITLDDAMGGNSFVRVTASSGKFKINGGRLGRDHTLDDVPNHFVRDRIMSYIQTELPAEVQDEVQKLVFDDLTEAELHGYGGTIQCLRDRDSIAIPISQQKPVPKRPGAASGAAGNLLKLEQAIDAIESDNLGLGVSIQGFEPGGTVDYETICWKSCIKPGQQPSENERKARQSDLQPSDWNCDNVRARIARLVKYNNEWTVDNFRKALGGIDERTELLKFLQHRGPNAGRRMRLYQLASDFFRLREILGIPLPSPAENATAKKRKRQPLEERAANRVDKYAEVREKSSNGKKAKSSN